MKLPSAFVDCKEWTLVGPMGPALPEELLTYPILGVDGGARFCERMDVWVGDGDSHKLNLNCENVYQFSPYKSQSDLALALVLLKDSPILTLHCWGLLGGRRDHELINLGEMLTFLENKPRSIAYFYDHNKNIPVKLLGAGTWKLNHHGPFSMASLKSVSVKIGGHCSYQLENLTELSPLSSFGLSNHAQGEFEITCLGPLMVLFPESE